MAKREAKQYPGPNLCEPDWWHTATCDRVFDPELIRKAVVDRLPEGEHLIGCSDPQCGWAGVVVVPPSEARKPDPAMDSAANWPVCSQCGSACHVALRKR
jgi:hypothetical protein